MYLNSFVYSKFIEILSKLTIRILKDYLYIYFVYSFFCLPSSRAAIDYFSITSETQCPRGLSPTLTKGNGGRQWERNKWCQAGFLMVRAVRSSHLDTHLCAESAEDV